MESFQDHDRSFNSALAPRSTASAVGLVQSIFENKGQGRGPRHRGRIKDGIQAVPAKTIAHG